MAIYIQLNKVLNTAADALHLQIDLQIKTRSVVALYGASGAGKTSILRLIAGLIPCRQGYIEVQQQLWLDTRQKICLKPQQRAVAMLFQDYALFPNMTVQQNLKFALRKGQDIAIVDELVEIMALTTLQNRYPTTLSGGQQQRVALARALIQRPALLLLDEPLSALDDEMRQKLQNYILQVHRRYQLTTILVSHDQREIERLADRVLVLENGKIVADGTPQEIFYKNHFPPSNGQVISTEQITPQAWGAIGQTWRLVSTPQFVVTQKNIVPHASETHQTPSHVTYFFYVLSGTVTFFIDDEKRIIKPHQGIYILPLTTYRIHNESKYTISLLALRSGN